MKKWLVFIVIILFSAGFGEARYHQIPKGPGRQKNRPNRQEKKAPAGKPVEKEDPFKAVIVMEARTGKILEAENEHLKRAPASVVKLMLAAMVLEKLTRGELKLTDKMHGHRRSLPDGRQPGLSGSRRDLHPGGDDEGRPDRLRQ